MNYFQKFKKFIIILDSKMVVNDEKLEKNHSYYLSEFKKDQEILIYDSRKGEDIRVNM